MGRRNLEFEQEMFLEFLNMTKEDQLEHFGFTTQREFAEKYNLPHEKLLSEWKANPKFKKRRQEKFIDSFGDILPQAKKAISVRGIEDGDVNALKEIFKIAGVSVDRKEIITKDNIEDVLNTIVEILNEKLDNQPELLEEIAKELESRLGDL